MTFFPFGIPSSASFAETALIARDLYTPSYSAAHANVARKAPPGSPAAQATDVGCPDGYTSAILPTPGYTPVPTNPNVDRSGYVLCFQLPPAGSPSPTPTVTPSITPSATLPPTCEEGFTSWTCVGDTATRTYILSDCSEDPECNGNLGDCTNECSPGGCVEGSGCIS
jgi:hypothetical protein